MPRVKKFFTLCLMCCIIFIPLMLSSCKYNSDDSGVNNVDTSSSVSKESAAIPIAMATDENYVLPTIVAMTSVMENKNPNTCYSFYVMHTHDLSDGAKKKLISLQSKFNQCQVNLLDMKDEYEYAHTDSRIPASSYYRLSLPKLLPDVEKVIWMDSDTLTFYDLTEMINIDMNGYYFKGFLDDSVGVMDKFGIYNDHYICSGVMLINLKELRDNNMDKQFTDFIKKNNDKLEQHDQTVINMVCYERIGILPAKFGIFNCINLDNMKSYVDALRTPQKYSLDEVRQAIENPTILHFVVKPWKKNTTEEHKKLWLSYAQKTDFLDEIKAKYSLLADNNAA